MISDIINDNEIFGLIDKNQKCDEIRLNDIIQKALELNGLDENDVASLLSIENPELLEKLFHTANTVKDEIYGNRLVLFAPLYVSNYCANNCLYCGFRVENKEITRTSLSLNQINDETISILEQGHKRILLLMGESDRNLRDDFLFKTIETIYNARDSKGSNIRRINLEIAPLDIDGFKKLASVEIGTYTVFQETYHRDTYKKMHPFGPKSDYDFRLSTMDRALQNGMHDVGIGALFGLFDYKFEVISMLKHAKHLDSTYNVGPHTISVPRINAASNSPVTLNIPYKVNDTEFKKIIAILRCAVPYTGIILSTRESATLRTELFNLGVSQISAGSKTNPGGYKQASSIDLEAGQFSLNDCRTSGEVIQDVLKHGFIPSFCTACYRLGRVGEDFMDLAKPGLIKSHCHPNGLCTLKEYLNNYADDDTKHLGEVIIQQELDHLPNENVKKKTLDYLSRIDSGEMDLYF